MLDHVFMTAIGALREAFEGALLERQAFDERLQTDILLGDLTWETAYGLPGEGTPPRVRAELTLEWPTWSQAAYRSWSLGEELEDDPEMLIELVLRVQNLRAPVDPATLVAALPVDDPAVGDAPLERSGPTIEQQFDADLQPVAASLEITFDGVYAIGETSLADSAALREHFRSLGGWVAGALVRLGDLKLDYLPPEEAENL